MKEYRSIPWIRDTNCNTTFFEILKLVSLNNYSLNYNQRSDYSITFRNSLDNRDVFCISKRPNYILKR